MEPKTKVLILGAGFGGVKSALELGRETRFDVKLLSDSDDFRYFPTLYRAATGGKLTASSIPLSEILSGKNVHFVHDSAQTLNRAKKQIGAKSGKNYEFDVLIVALGSVTNYFGIKGLEQYAYGIKSVEEAVRFRDHVHKILADSGKPDINYVIIGGGPTGVELAGALPGYLHHVMKSHGIEKAALHIDLVESAERILPRMPASYSAKVTRRLEKLGVSLYLGQKVESATAEALMVSGHSIDSHTVVWTAGVASNPFLAANEFALAGHGKAKVNQYLATEDDIYVIGDNADTPYSGMAQTALYDALFVADNLRRQVRGRSSRAYRPKEPDYVIPVGEGWAAVMIGRLKLYGRLGWWVRRVADFIAYRDLEPWWKASRLWRSEGREEENCPICSQ